MSQEQRQQAAHEEKLVPSADRVKISATNMRIEPSVPQKTLATIINKCLSGKTSNNDRLRQSRVAIFWGMFHEENVDYLELIWEDFAYKINYRQARLRRREIMSYPRFTKIIINHFLSLNPSIPKVPRSGMHTIKDDEVIRRLKFVKIGEDFEEYGRTIPKTMLTEGIKKAKKKVSISADDNIIPEPDVALELGKSMSLTEAKEEEAARRVHATHERLVTESDPKPARRSTRRRPSGIDFRDTSSVSKKKSPDQSQKLKGSSEGTGVSPGVPDESTVILTTSSEGNGTKPGVPDEVKGSFEAKEEEKKDDDEDDKSIDIKKTDDDEESDDEFMHGDEYVHDDVDEEMKYVAKTRKDDEEIIDVEKTDAEKTEVTKGDLEQARKLPLTSSSLFVSSGFGNQFLNLSSDTSLIGTTKESADIEINSLLDIQIQQEVPHIQSPSILTVPVLMIPKPMVLSPIPEIPTVTPVTTLLPPPFITNLTHVLQQQTTPIPTPPITTAAPSATTIPDPLPAIVQRVSKLEKDVQELKQVDQSLTIIATIRSQVPAAVDEYLGSSLGDALQKIKQEQAAKEKMLKFLATPYDLALKAEFKQKLILFKMNCVQAVVTYTPVALTVYKQ
ncbi:hypothetical protein Tco_0845897 [Tanacetum coccineum]